MALLLWIVIPAMILIGCVDVVFVAPAMNVSPWFFVVMVIFSTIYQVLIDGLFAFLCNQIPAKWLKNKKFFEVSKKEQKFYEKLGIRAWKDKVLELGGMGGFSKSKIDDPNNPEYIEKFLIESYKGEIDHISGMIAGFSVIFIIPLKYAWFIGVPVAIVNVVVNLMSTMILRYNTPKLKTLHKRALRTQELKNSREATEQN